MKYTMLKADFKHLANSQRLWWAKLCHTVKWPLYGLSLLLDLNNILNVLWHKNCTFMWLLQCVYFRVTPKEWEVQRMDIFHLVSWDYCICSMTILKGLQAWEIGFSSGKRISGDFNVKQGFGNSKEWKKFQIIYETRSSIYEKHAAVDMQIEILFTFMSRS